MKAFWCLVQHRSRRSHSFAVGTSRLPTASFSAESLGDTKAKHVNANTSVSVRAGGTSADPHSCLTHRSSLVHHQYLLRFQSLQGCQQQLLSYIWTTGRQNKHTVLSGLFFFSPSLSVERVLLFQTFPSFWYSAAPHLHEQRPCLGCTTEFPNCDAGGIFACSWQFSFLCLPKLCGVQQLWSIG